MSWMNQSPLAAIVAALRRPRPAPAAPAAAPLPPRKQQIVRLVARGLSNKEIARELLIKERTVEAHLEHLRARLGVRNRAQLAAWAVAQGLVPADETPSRLWGKTGDR